MRKNTLDGPANVTYPAANDLQDQTVTVSSRLVLMFPGFEPLPAEAHCRRFVREAAKTAPLYGMTLSPSAVTAERRSASAVGTGSFSVKAAGDGWATDTEIVIYELSELNEDYAARNPVSRFVLGLVALADFIVTGTFFRYLPTGWRYAFFFIFPLLVVIGAALAAWLGYVVGAAVFPASPALAGSVAAIAAGLLALYAAQRRWNFLLAMDDWAVARDLARGRNPAIAARFALLSADVVRRAKPAKPRRYCSPRIASAPSLPSGRLPIRCAKAARRNSPACSRSGRASSRSRFIRPPNHCAPMSKRSSRPIRRGSTCSR